MTLTSLRKILDAAAADKDTEAALPPFYNLLAEDRFRPLPHRQDTLSFAAVLTHFDCLIPAVQRRLEEDILGRWQRFARAGIGAPTAEAPAMAEDGRAQGLAPLPEPATDNKGRSGSTPPEMPFGVSCKPHSRDWFDKFLDFCTVMLHPGYVP